MLNIFLGGASFVRYSQRGLEHEDQSVATGITVTWIQVSQQGHWSCLIEIFLPLLICWVQAASGNLAASVFWEGPRVAFSIIWVVPTGTDVKKPFFIFWSHFISVLLEQIMIGTHRVVNHGLAVHSFICELNLGSLKERAELRSSLGSQVRGWRSPVQEVSWILTDESRRHQASHRPGTSAPVDLTSRDLHWSSWKSRSGESTEGSGDVNKDT